MSKNPDSIRFRMENATMGIRAWMLDRSVPGDQ
jgi:hypothetical protein